MVADAGFCVRFDSDRTGPDLPCTDTRLVDLQPACTFPVSGQYSRPVGRPLSPERHRVSIAAVLTLRQKPLDVRSFHLIFEYVDFPKWGHAAAASSFRV